MGGCHTALHIDGWNNLPVFTNAPIQQIGIIFSVKRKVTLNKKIEIKESFSSIIAFHWKCTAISDNSAALARWFRSTNWGGGVCLSWATPSSF